jgi:hypothetical protein
MNQNIPILTYHSVGNHEIVRPWSFLSVTIEVFENQMRFLKSKGFSTITLKDLYEIKFMKQKVPPKTVILNFDDGFLDNWTLVYPILKKYGFKATVYVSPDFVDPRPIVREHVYSKVIKGEKVKLEHWWGYASWDELKIMESTGVFDVQGHAMTHTWYPTSPEIIDIHYPKDTYYWLWWNNFREKKPYWLTEYKDIDVDFGTPIFQFDKSLVSKRFLPSTDVIDFCIKNVQKKENSLSLDRRVLLNELRTKVKSIFGDNIGRYETDVEYNIRITDELVNSKNIIESRLAKRVEFLAWPGGGQTEYTRVLAKDAGYLATTMGGKFYNNINDNPFNYYRLGAWTGITFNNKPIQLMESMFFKVQLNRGQNKKTITTLGAVSAKGVINQINRNRNMDKLRD